MTYESVMHYSLATPTYNTKKEDSNKLPFDNSLDANNPDNFNEFDYEEE